MKINLQNSTSSIRHHVLLLYGIIFAVTVFSWAAAVCMFYKYPVLLGTAFLAYSLGLRHAVDADHIAAIDNVTRKLMQDGKRSVAVGFFFSLGHSLVIVLACVAAALTAGAIKKFEALHAIGGLISTLVSSGFLLLLALLNVIIFFQIYATFQKVRKTGLYVEEDLNILLSKRGFLSRMFRCLFGMVRTSWQMFFIGFLFGLGFDTATEMAVLGIAAAQAAKGIVIWSIMIFPVLFTAGMTLVDTTDGVLMLGAYQWAFITPMRKLYYNMTITAVSVVVALVIGGIEALGLVADRFSLKGSFWDFMSGFGSHFNVIGFGLIGLFLSAWGISVLVYRLKRYDDVEIKKI